MPGSVAVREGTLWLAGVRRFHARFAELTVGVGRAFDLFDSGDGPGAQRALAAWVTAQSFS